MADEINRLPVDESVVTHNEASIIETLFKDNKKTVKSVFQEMKESVVAGILFIILNLPPVDRLISLIIPSVGNSFYILLVIKAILFIIILYIVKNISLLRK